VRHADKWGEEVALGGQGEGKGVLGILGRRRKEIPRVGCARRY